jgi:hypothetical protein
MKNALCYALWSAEINPRVAAVMFLIEKMGKCPKERHLEKAIGMNCEELFHNFFLLSAVNKLPLLSR